MQSAELCQTNEGRAAVLRFLTAADLGIVGIEVAEEEVGEEILQALEAIRPIFGKRGGEAPLFPKTVQNVAFQHKGAKGDVSIPLNYESDGTQALFRLLGPAISVLSTGGVLCVDELDASLHPILAKALVAAFNQPESNPKAAQLIFNTHDTNLLDSNVLRRDQIWFTEKDSDGATHLYPLSEFKPRKGENFERGYLQGRYGGIPFISSEQPLLEDEAQSR